MGIYSKNSYTSHKTVEILESSSSHTTGLLEPSIIRLSKYFEENFIKFFFIHKKTSFWVWFNITVKLNVLLLTLSSSGSRKITSFITLIYPSLWY